MWSDIISIIILVTTALILLYTAYILNKTGKIAEKNLQHNMIVYLQKEYRSPDMLYALRSLWDLYDQCFNELNYRNINKLKEDQKKTLKEKLMKKYKARYDSENDFLNGLDIEQSKDKSESQKKSFDNQRRLVSHFYNHLYTLYLNEIIDEEIIKNLFNDIDTLEKICIPLEEKLIEIIWKKRGLTKDQLDEKKYHSTRNLKYLIDILKDC